MKVSGIPYRSLLCCCRVNDKKAFSAGLQNGWQYNAKVIPVSGRRVCAWLAFCHCDLIQTIRQRTYLLCKHGAALLRYIAAPLLNVELRGQKGRSSSVVVLTGGASVGKLLSADGGATIGATGFLPAILICSAVR